MIKEISDIDFDQLTDRSFTPSPVAWEDEVLYFLLLDRFSDNNESGFAPGGTTPLYQNSDNGNAVGGDADKKAWQEAGGFYVNGNFKGLRGKLSYLKNLGITAVWISPVFKQVAFQDTYHGYGIQDFLEVNSHFGTKEELIGFVQEAHAAGIYILLDIILNHSGNVFSYDPDRYLTTKDDHTFIQARWDDEPYKVKGFNNAMGQPLIDFSSTNQALEDDAIWPREFQEPATFTQKGEIVNWDYDPEFLEGDFLDLKDIHLGTGPLDDFKPSKALLSLVDVYRYWIALLDIDGYRIDSVKHMAPGAVRFFASAIHEFAQQIGKDNFYLIGEITGDRKFAFNILEATGVDAALGIADVQQMLCNTVKGLTNPAGYFDLFRNSILIGKDSHTWFRDKVVVMLDDHDKVSQGGHKARFSAFDEGDKLNLNALATNLTTLGIPCIYYGSEQSFDGEGDSDKYIREAMFGGAFGAFRSKGRHFFDTASPVYQELANIIALRKKIVALRRGRQYLREISGDGEHFGLPAFLGDTHKINTVVAWSRIIDNDEIIVATNTDPVNEISVWITLDASIHSEGDIFKAVYPVTGNPPHATVEPKNGKAIFLQVPAAGFVIYVK